MVLAYPDFTKPFDTSPPPLNNGAMITQDNRPIAYAGRTFQRTINNAITKLELLVKGVQWNVVGTQIYVYTNNKNLIGDGQVGFPTEYSTERYSKRDMSPRYLYVRIHNTVADATLVNNPKSQLGY